MNSNQQPSYVSPRYLKIIIALLVVVILLLLLKRNSSPEPAAVNPHADHTVTDKRKDKPKPSVSNSIDELTATAVVVPYVKEHKRLPDYYITKNEARHQGWNPAAGNLCDILPGRAIGGDVFSNREGRLPKEKGRKWFEADLNYNCGNRNADRLLFSSDGLVYITTDHYQTFIQQ